MPLEYTSLPPIPRGMNLAGPSLFIDEAYCRWMQDILVDRPGQIRMRGPLTNWVSPTVANYFSAGQQALGATSTINPLGSWRGAVFATTTSNTSGTFANGSGIVKVFSNDSNGASQVEGTFTLPFNLNTKYNSTTKHWENNTIIDAKPALGGGVWIGVTDEYGILTDTTNSKQALMLWRGGTKEAYETGLVCSYSYKSKSITGVTSASTLIDSGMFVFDTTSDANGNGRYLGVVSSVSGTTITLEKQALYTSTSGSSTSRKLLFTSVRGFVPQHGRGVSSTDTGVYVTSGRLGSDAEGLFGAARFTINPDGVGSHRVFVYRQSDHQFIGQIEHNGTVSNTQVKMTANHATDPSEFLKDDNYLIVRDDTNLVSSGVTYDTKKYSMLFSNRRPDSNPELVSTSVYLPVPGVFNSTYANRQWFASVGNTGISSDKFVNRVVFSGTDNAENINLSPDASDSIIIPGREAIRGIAGSVSGLLVFVENKTYIVRGTNRQNFALEELYPDGTLSTSSIVQVGGGVIWAGKAGIYYYDGVSVRNFTNQSLGIFYTDGIERFNATTDRVYAFVYNNYLIINFSKWNQNYPLTRLQATHQNSTGTGAIITLDNTQNYSILNPNSITFSIFLPSGSIGTVTNITPRGFMTASSAAKTDTKGIMLMNARGINDTTGVPTSNTANLINLGSIFTEVIDDVTLDSVLSNDTNRSRSDIAKRGPDFYFETKQYNFGESTLRKWWRKIMFNISINNGFMVTEFVDINDTSLADTVTFVSYDVTIPDTLSTTLSGSVYPYTNTKTFVVPDVDLLSDADYLKLTHTNNVTNKVSNGTTATLTVANHGLNIGDTILVSGVDSNLDGSRVLTGVTTNTLSFASTSTIVSVACSGTININVYGFVVSRVNNTNTVTFRITSTSTSGTHSGWAVSRQPVIRNTDESGFILVPNTALSWGYYENLSLTWQNVQNSTLSWAAYFGNKTIRYSKWIGIRQNSLGFRFYSLRNYIENGVEQVPETVEINDWTFGLKALRKGRN